MATWQEKIEERKSWRTTNSLVFIFSLVWTRKIHRNGQCVVYLMITIRCQRFYFRSNPSGNKSPVRLCLFFFLIFSVCLHPLRLLLLLSVELVLLGSGVRSRTQDDYYDIFLSFCFLFFISFFFVFYAFSLHLYSMYEPFVSFVSCVKIRFSFSCKILSENHFKARKFIITWTWRRRRHWRQQRWRWWMVMTQPEAVAMLCYDMTLNDNNNNILETFLRIKWIDTILLLT